MTVHHAHHDRRQVFRFHVQTTLDEGGSRRANTSLFRGVNLHIVTIGVVEAKEEGVSFPSDLQRNLTSIHVSTELLAKRNRLLASCLRQNPSPFHNEQRLRNVYLTQDKHTYGTEQRAVTGLQRARVHGAKEG